LTSFYSRDDAVRAFDGVRLVVTVVSPVVPDGD
jgi:hypothetical protein